MDLAWRGHLVPQSGLKYQFIPSIRGYRTRMGYPTIIRITQYAIAFWGNVFFKLPVVVSACALREDLFQLRNHKAGAARVPVFQA